MNESTTASVVAKPTPSAPCDALQALVAAHQQDDHPKEEALHQTDPNILGMGVLYGVVPIIDAREHPVHVDRDGIPGADSAHDRQANKYGH